MKTLFRFHLVYFLLSILLFITEVLIATYVHDSIIRPYGGDFLVVILLYCMIRSICKTPILPTALAVLVFACIVETTQYFRLADHLGLPYHSWIRLLLGSYFSWTDILCYTLGILSVLLTEKLIRRQPLKSLTA